MFIGDDDALRDAPNRPIGREKNVGTLLGEPSRTPALFRNSEEALEDFV
jgi:hypothetical protein